MFQNNFLKHENVFFILNVFFKVKVKLREIKLRGIKILFFCCEIFETKLIEIGDIYGKYNHDDEV